MMILLISAAGGLGAVARLVADGVLRQRIASQLPLATACINITGAFLLGVLSGLHAQGILGTDALRLLGTGFLGGFTTMSTASVEVVRAWQTQGARKAVLFSVGVAIIAVAAAALGYAIVR